MIGACLFHYASFDHPQEGPCEDRAGEREVRVGGAEVVVIGPLGFVGANVNEKINDGIEWYLCNLTVITT